jgi:hypothetical protein
MLVFLNILFFVLHLVVLIFNLIGWIWRSTRRWHLISVGITLLSWIGFGYWYGWGYCFLTDWHWQIRRELGYFDPASFTELLMVNILKLPVSTVVVDWLTVGGITIATILSVVLYVRDKKSMTGE